MSAPTIEEQIAEVERVILQRQHFYDRRMNSAVADRQFECLVAALQTLQTVKRLEEIW